MGAMTKRGLSALAGTMLLFRERLYAVGDGLEEPEGADPVRSAPYLEPAENLSLRERQVGDEAHEDGDHDDVLDERIRSGRRGYPSFHPFCTFTSIHFAGSP